MRRLQSIPILRGSHSGGVMSMGAGGALFHGSKKQKLNTRSSTEAELVGVDDYATNILWTKLFLEEHVSAGVCCSSVAPLVSAGWRVEWLLLRR
eukprot:scaffold8236_cov189-Cylindrotheca_fusiformis.AAC.1